MEHQDNLFEQFKKAAENSETKEFPGMEKVWSRVDAKLDTQVYETQKQTNTSWKKFAVAASVVITAMFAYQYLKPETPTQTTITNTIVQKDSIETVAPETDQAVVENETTPVLNKREAEKVLNQQISSQQQVALATPSISSNDTLRWMAKPALAPKEEAVSYNTNAASSGYVNYESKDKADDFKETRKKSAQAPKKADPLVVVDGKALSEEDKANYIAEEMESIVELKNPLYIINGVEYSEKEVFGPNATSPYYPLNKQEIESISIYQDEEAYEKFGRKGDNGVVVIKTKNGKPVSVKK